MSRMVELSGVWRDGHLAMIALVVCNEVPRVHKLPLSFFHAVQYNPASPMACQRRVLFFLAPFFFLLVSYFFDVFSSLHLQVLAMTFPLFHRVARPEFLIEIP
jgi:hypothetical protein